MNLRAYWHFYQSIFPFCATFGVLAMLTVGLFWGFLFYATVGLWFGFFGFGVFRIREYYFYYNLGLTKWKLYRISFLLNLLVGIPVFCALALFKFLVLGSA